MSKKQNHIAKVILYDTLAGLCFIGVVLFGWLPGPGGIPLLLLGLTFLAVNHDWAERWIETVKIHGKTIKSILFPAKPLVRAGWDVLSVSAVVTGIVLALMAENRFVAAFGAMMMTGGLVVFLFNRERLDKLSGLFRRKGQ